MLPGNRAFTVTATCALILVAGCAGARHEETRRAPASLAGGYGVEVEFAVQRVRAATARFVSLDSAVAAGYAASVERCWAHPQHGAMGFHHVNRSLMDATVEVERPEILIYERLGDGRYVLNGVEYIIPYSRWSRDSTPPTLMGQRLKRADDLLVWYLHMWVWRENAAGLFADWHPDVRCPTG